MSDQVTYTITVDRAMFPYPPGSEVVVRNGIEEWRKAMFLSREGSYIAKPEVGCAYGWNECHPLATHGHLLGTTYPADTPKCAKCGKAAPEPMFVNDEPYCAECFEVWAKGIPLPDNNYDLDLDKPTATTADGVTVKEGDAVWHPDKGKMRVLSGGGTCQKENIIGGMNVPFWTSDCYSRPCARLADGSVAMVGDRVRTPNGNTYPLSLASDGRLFVQRPDHCDDIKARDCYPIGSHIMTPAELDALKAKQSPARTKKKTGEPLSGLCATCYVGESCEYNGEQSCASYAKDEEHKDNPPEQPGEFKPFQKVLVRGGVGYEWKCDIYSHFSEIYNKHTCVGGCCWKYVLPYEGNEHLLGTTDSPEVK